VQADGCRLQTFRHVINCIIVHTLYRRWTGCRSFFYLLSSIHVYLWWLHKMQRGLCDTVSVGNVVKRRKKRETEEKIMQKMGILSRSSTGAALVGLGIELEAAGRRCSVASSPSGTLYPGWIVTTGGRLRE